MSKRNSNNTYLLSGLVLFGGIVGATACTAPSEQPAAAPAPAPEWKQTFEPVKSLEVVQDVAEPKPVAPTKEVEPQPTAKTVDLAIAHEDATDYGDQARALMDKGDKKAALVALRKHLHTAKPTPELLLTVGKTARDIKAFDIAEAALEQGIALDPTRGELAVELARVHIRAGHPKKGEKAARRALRANRDDATAWNQLGRAAMAQSRWELAEVAYGRAVYLDPVDGLVHNNLGLLYVYMKNGTKAVDTLERAVELLEDETPYYVFNNLGLAHELVGQHEEAREAFEEALLLNPFYTRAKVNLDRVEARLAAIEEKSAFKTAQGAELETAPKPEPDDA